MNFSGNDDVSEILAKSNPTASKLWRIANVSIVLAVLGVATGVFLLVLTILFGSSEPGGLIDILPVLSMLSVMAAGLAYFVFCVCFIAIAILFKDYIWAIAIFLFSILAVLYRGFKAREIKTKNTAR